MFTVIYQLEYGASNKMDLNQKLSLETICGRVIQHGINQTPLTMEQSM